MAAFLRKYGTGTGADLWIPIIKRAVVDFAVGADWTPATGDVKVSKDGAAANNIGTLPTALVMGNGAVWKFVFSDTVDTRLVRARHGDSSGVRGAAWLWNEHESWPDSCTT